MLGYLLPRVTIDFSFCSTLFQVDSTQYFLIACFAAILIPGIVTYFLWGFSGNTVLPPLAPLSYVEVLQHIADGSLHKICLELSRSVVGPIFRLRWIGYRHGVFIVTDGMIFFILFYRSLLLLLTF